MNADERRSVESEREESEQGKMSKLEPGTRCKWRKPPRETIVTVEIESGPEYGMDVNPQPANVMPGRVEQYRVKEVPGGARQIANAAGLTPIAMATRKLDPENVVQCPATVKPSGQRCERQIKCPRGERAERLPKQAWGLKNGRWHCPIHCDG